MNIRRKCGGQRGNSMLEFTFVGIPLIFVLISIFEISRGMWVYHTLAYAVRDATRFVIVKGKNCSTNPNACSVTVTQIAQRIHDSGVGLDPNTLTVTMTSSSRTIGPDTLQNLLTSGSYTTNYWPAVSPGSTPDEGSAQNQPITITATIPFSSAIALFWTGTRGVGPFPTFNLWATSMERIQF